MPKLDSSPTTKGYFTKRWVRCECGEEFEVSVHLPSGWNQVDATCPTCKRRGMMEVVP